MENCSILVDRLAQFYPQKRWTWNKNIITLDEIKIAIEKGILEQRNEFGNAFDSMNKIESKTDEWHIARIIYFINHPEEIKGLFLENLCVKSRRYPVAVITDGNHRFVAAQYLGIKVIDHCEYAGRQDLLDYLLGLIEDCPIE